MKEKIIPLRFLNETNELIILDQTALPNETVYLTLTTSKEVFEAISLLRVRGAPLIGIAAAFGLYLSVKNIVSSVEEFSLEFLKNKLYLESSRPTAVNLSYALWRMSKCLEKNRQLPLFKIKECLYNEALSILNKEEAACEAIGKNGLSFIKEGYGILTHCNAGMLATNKYGTATAPIYLAHEKGISFKVYADETRPLLQGARLTAFELLNAGIDVTLLCDNMAGAAMKKGLIDAIFVGCDRVSMNGDSANKIGTLSLAILAKHFGIPLYICAPTSTIDPSSKTGEDIIIEQRGADEVTSLFYKKPSAPAGISVLNPAFDVTDNSLITAIITENAVAYPPFEKSLAALLLKNNA